MTFLHTIEITGRLLKNDGYSYNEALMTYNSAIAYGGMYGFDSNKPVCSDVIDVVSSWKAIDDVKPS